ncbi:receptor-like protein 9DC3 [Lycium barbarum]|uniref:receptor-like protein 9DC3 n=1 Tax=Lycium barbarum TaxID=112863 RepID=UPI00293EFA2D|nr:receptor-like protein 9DC3 [Lycium barbarum]
MGYEYLLFVLASFFLCQLAFSSSVTHLCSKDESISLLKFKNTLTVCEFGTEFPFCYCQQSSPKTRSWNMSRDCCSWDGVVCDDFIGHVIELDLGCSQLQGKIDSNSSLFQLSHLRMLTLSLNSFSNSHISPEFGKFSSLTHLDLSWSNFSGQIPSEFSHLSKLQSLYLGGNDMLFGPHNFKLLLQNLTQLRELDLTNVNISSTIPPNFSSHLTTLWLGSTGLYGIIPESIFHLPNLETLALWGNHQLSGDFPKTKWNSSASLKVLDLNRVNFSGNFLPESLGYLTVLRYLILDSCNLSGPIPRSLWNLTRLEYMSLGDNQLEGPIPLFTTGLRNLKSLSLLSNSLNGAIPSWVFSLPSLTELSLRNNHFSSQLEDFNSNTLESISLEDNQLQGPLPRSLQNLVNLTTLGLSYNNFSGNVDVSFFSNLKQLRKLDLSYNSISLTNENKVKSTLPKYLESLFLSACEVKELDFLRSTEELSNLDLSNNKIKGRIPDWAWSNWMHMEYLNLSHNMLTSIDHISSLSKLHTIDLGSNSIEGSLPILSPSVNLFFISNNSLSGEIPSSFCNLTSLIVLDLARNKLKGTIPRCLGNMSDYFEVLDMQYNSLSGYLRTTFSSRSQLKSFNLHGNKIEGKIPRSLSNCKQLEVLDLGNNHLNDTFPMWLGTLPKLQVLSLRSNKLHGPIKASRINNLFPQLRMLDLSCNAFTAELPTRLFQNLKGMRRIDQTVNSPRDQAKTGYQDSVTVVTKGLELEVVRILSLYSTMDLSNNKFEGHIPSVLGELISLRVLNLSHNGLEGHIPPSLGELSVVGSLALSFNNISGEIPSSVCNLKSLKVLDLARNNLKGTIPQCLGNMSDYLEVLDMQYNSLSGYLRTAFNSRSQLKSFNLHGNKVEGKIPRSLSNCKQLEVLDLGNNHLNDTFPMWLGTLPKLQILSLRSNKLHGPIRTLRINNLFSQLRMLDLCCNAFTAELPTRLFQNLKGMRRIDQTMNSPRDQAQTGYQDSVTVVTKGLELEVVRILSLYSTMDLSNNKFEGHIPSVLGELISLRVLNLSHNGLEGHIPPSLGELSVVESLDLSFNKISGEIPQRLASLTYLEFLNLSSNHLAGCIPKGPQFATFENNSYEGNAGLRGFPVSEDCGSSWIPDSNNTTFVPDEESDSSFLSELSWKVVLTGYGCGLFIGCIIAYFMLSSQNPNWLSGIAGDLEYRIITRRRKKQRSQRHYRRRNNGF